MTNREIIEAFLARTAVQVAIKNGEVTDPAENASQFVREARERWGLAYLPGTLPSAARYVRQALSAVPESDLTREDIEDAISWRAEGERAERVRDIMFDVLVDFWVPPVARAPVGPSFQLLNVTDAHIGSEEGCEHLLTLLDRSIEYAEAGVLALGGDLLHFDTPHRTTTKGTHIDAEMDYRVMAAEAVRFTLTAIERARLMWSSVHVVFVEGNHDTFGAAMLAAAIEATAPAGVRVHRGVRPALELPFGWLVFDHCYHVQPKKLLAQIPTLYPGHAHHLVTGHRHHQACFQADNGVWLLQGASPEQATEYETRGAYISTRGMTSHMWTAGVRTDKLVTR